MKLRKIVSLTASLAFLVMLLTSLLLYIAPQGRVAYWSDWRFWGLDKTQWGNIHMNVGLIFLLTLGLHIYYNWTALVSYLRDQSKQLIIATREFSLALILLIAVIAGTYAELPPLVYVQRVNDLLKESAAAKYGEPPYGHAELSSVKTVAARMGLDPGKLLLQLAQAQVRVDNEDQTILAIARLNNRTPKQIYDAMLAASSDSAPSRRPMPDQPPAGFGKNSLADVAGQYGLNIEDILTKLEVRAVTAARDMSIKDIAAQNGMGPHELYKILLEVGRSQPAKPEGKD